jgi:hypothetical protein
MNELTVALANQNAPTMRFTKELMNGGFLTEHHSKERLPQKAD